MQTKQHKPRQKAADRIVQRLFVALEKAIQATDEARKARDELVALGKGKEDRQ